MSSTVLRLGLWIVIIVLAAYVIHESFEEQPVAEMIPMAMLGKALTLGGILIVAGVVVRIFEKGAGSKATPRQFPEESCACI